MFETIFYILGSLAFAMYLYRCIKPPKTRIVQYHLDKDGKVNLRVYGGGTGTD